MNMDAAHVVQGIHHWLKSRRDSSYFVLKISDGSA